MKSKYVILASAILISVSTFAQKEELKTLKKIYAKETPTASDLVEYKGNVVKLQGLATEEGDKVYYNFYKSMLPLLEVTALGQNATPAQIMKFLNAKAISDLAVSLNATLDFEKKSKKKIYTDDINETITSFKPIFLNYAISLVNQSQFKEAALALHSIYEIDKKDAEKLYYAANYAVSAKDYDLALQYYQELKTINYSGEGTTFFAKNTATDKDEPFESKEVRDKFVGLKTHTNPREEKNPSKRGEIYKNIALILVEKGKIEEAKTAIQEARKVNPEDSSLILTEADLYYKLNDMVTYKKLISEALEKNPNDADLIFNLGVVSLKSNQTADAEKYFLKAIEINPKYTNAYLNLAELKLQPDEKIVKEMNGLGTSVKDNKRYEVLKAERVKVFKNAMPHLEKALELDPKNEVVIDNLLSVYNFLEMTDKYKALKSKK
jgi:tetratricopeptide (TPR) repeat protein